MVNMTLAAPFLETDVHDHVSDFEHAVSAVSAASSLHPDIPQVVFCYHSLTPHGVPCDAYWSYVDLVENESADERFELHAFGGEYAALQAAVEHYWSNHPEPTHVDNRWVYFDEEHRTIVVDADAVAWDGQDRRIPW